jgi:hypothetical protein
VLIRFGPGSDEYLGQHYRPSDDDYSCVDDFDEYHYSADDHFDHHYDDQCRADDDTA